MFATRFDVLCVLAAFAGGCSAVTPRSPTETVSVYLKALRRGDVKTAEALVERGGHVGESPLVPAAIRSDGLREAETEVVWTGDEARLGLVFQGGRWWIRDGILRAMWPVTPEACLALFAQAIDQRDLALLRRLLPVAMLELLKPQELDAVPGRSEWRALAEGLGKGHFEWLARDAERAEARVKVGAELHTLVIVREGGLWKVFDVRPWKGYLPR